ncbi:MAG TPA: hypothetical protein VGC46_11295 [Allosphingosinicella sp.]
MFKLNRKDSLILPRHAMLLLLLPVFIIVFGDLLFSGFGWQDPIAPQTRANFNPRVEAIGRTRVLTTLLPFVLVSVFLVLAFARDALTLFGPNFRARLLVPLSALLVLMVTMVVTSLSDANGPEGGLGEGFFATVFPVKEGSATLEWAKDLTGAATSQMAILRICLGIFMAFLVAGATAAILGTISTTGEPNVADPSEYLHLCRLQKSRLDAYLMGSALLLVTGLFFMDACMRWPVGVTADPVYGAHIDALMLQNGVYYSTIIASYFIPAAFWIITSTRRETEPADGDEPVTDEAVALGWFTPGRLLQSGTAILAPVIAAVVSQMVQG